jgi:hypothetical protein
MQPKNYKGDPIQPHLSDPHSDLQEKPGQHRESEQAGTRKKPNWSCCCNCTFGYRKHTILLTNYPQETQHMHLSFSYQHYLAPIMSTTDTVVQL